MERSEFVRLGAPYDFLKSKKMWDDAEEHCVFFWRDAVLGVR